MFVAKSLLSAVTSDSSKTAESKTDGSKKADALGSVFKTAENLHKDTASETSGDVKALVKEVPPSYSDKPADFQVRVKIYSAKQLSGSNIHPVVNVTVGEKPPQHTRIRKGSAPVWEKLMMFNFHESLKILSDYEVEFVVKNSRNLRADSMIGEFKMTLGRVYSQPGHAFVDKYLLLTKPDDPSHTPQGFLNIMICVLGAGDQPPDEIPSKSSDVEGNLLTPAGATLQPVIFALRVFRADDLPQMDSAGLKSLLEVGEGAVSTKNLVDPYLIFSFAGKKCETSVIEETNDPVWNEQLNLRTNLPSTCDNIQLTLKDRDRLSKDDYIGRVFLPLAEISSSGETVKGSGYLPTFGPSFINFYGSPREFSEGRNHLRNLNKGKGEGCAYRGRVLVQLSLQQLKKKEKVSKLVPIDDDEEIEKMEKFMARQRYRLVVCLLSANLIHKKHQNVEFEVSIGNYGNKFDVDMEKACSVTEAVTPAFDGLRYHYIPWSSRKPLLMVTSQWENVNFRLFNLNFLLKLHHKMEERINNINEMIHADISEIEIASEIVELLDMIILATDGNKLLNPRGFQTSNNLDKRIYRQRSKTFIRICETAKDLRQNCTEIKLALTAVHEIFDIIKYLCHEPQNSIPDVFIWMISNKKRLCYYRIPAYDILHCHENSEYSGRFCSKPLDITLKVPKISKKKSEFSQCEMRVLAWFGLAENQKDFSLHTRGQISVYANTYEIETKNPIRGWALDGFKNISGEIDLPKSSFHPPVGWEWDGDWALSKEFSEVSTTPDETVLEECFVHEKRAVRKKWSSYKVIEVNGQEIKEPDSIKCPKGWEWAGNWAVDNRRACDADGWQYSAATEIEKSEVPWSANVKPFHTMRRRRLLRTRKNIDPAFLRSEEKNKILLGEGWEYATISKENFHPLPKAFDAVRRRKWIRKLITKAQFGPTAMFNLETTLSVSDSSYQSVQSAAQVEEASPKVKALLGVDSEENASSKRRLSDAFTTSSGSSDQSKAPLPMIFLSYKTKTELQLRAYIYQARDLLAMDEDAFSDPVIFVSMLDYCQRTAVMDKTLNPVWDQTLIMNITFYGDLGLLMKYCPPITLEVFDKDVLMKISGKSEESDYNPSKPVKGNLEFMGRAHGKPLIKFNPKSNVEPKLEWLSIEKGDVHGGSLLAAFELCLKFGKQEFPPPPPQRSEAIYKVPDAIRPVLRRTALEFLIWGVRNMSSYRLLPVSTPNVIIQIGDVVIKSDTIQSMKKNPNFSHPVYFATANLPVEENFFPPIIIRIKDNRKFGRKPTVGEFVIKNVSRYCVKPLPFKKKEIPPKPQVDKAATTAVEIEKPASEKTNAAKEEGSPSKPVDKDDLHEQPKTSSDTKPKEATTAVEIEKPASENTNAAKVEGSPSKPVDKKDLHEKSASETKPKDATVAVEVEKPTSKSATSSKEKDLSKPIDKKELHKKPKEASGKEIVESEKSDTKTKPKKGFKRFFRKSKSSDDKKKSGKTDPKSKSGKDKDKKKKVESDGADWWTKYYAFTPEASKDFLKMGLDTIKVYKNPLETQGDFHHFWDFIETFYLFREKISSDSQEEKDVVGEFKGALKIYELSPDPTTEMPPSYFEKIPSSDPVEVKVRIYVVRGFDLAPQDSNGLADPYLKIKAGKKKIDDRKNHLNNTLEPIFGRMFEMDLVLPMEKDLTVEVFDWDLIGGDDTIGKTVIDLENRYYSEFQAWCGLPLSYYVSGPTPWRGQLTPKQWLDEKAKQYGWDPPVWNGDTCVMLNGKVHSLEKYENNTKPSPHWGPPEERLSLHILRTFPFVTEHVEMRPLFNEAHPHIEQGRLHMWVDMFPKQYGAPNLAFDISPRKPDKHFLRIIIWNCSKIPLVDKSLSGQKMSDIYVKGWIGGLESDQCKTDVHYRSLNGVGMFNWRFVFPFDYLPQEELLYVSKKEHFWNLDKTEAKLPLMLNIQVWDQDLFSPNEFISEISLNMIKMPKASRFGRFCSLKDIPDENGNCRKQLVSIFDQRMLKGWWPLYKEVDGKRESKGRIEMTIEVLSDVENKDRPAGRGRDAPNMNPKLEKPNRPATSFAWFSSPWKSFRYIIWQRYKYYILVILIVILIVVFFVLLFYAFPSEIASMLSGFLHGGL